MLFILTTDIKTSFFTIKIENKKNIILVSSLYFDIYTYIYEEVERKKPKLLCEFLFSSLDLVIMK